MGAKKKSGARGAEPAAADVAPEGGEQVQGQPSVEAGSAKEHVPNSSALDGMMLVPNLGSVCEVCSV